MHNMKMQLILLCVLFIWIKLTASELTTREKIELHKAWLEKRAALKLQDPISNLTANPLFTIFKTKRFHPEFNQFNKNEVISFEKKPNKNVEKKIKVVQVTSTTRLPVTEVITQLPNVHNESQDSQLQNHRPQSMIALKMSTSPPTVKPVTTPTTTTLRTTLRTTQLPNNGIDKQNISDQINLFEPRSQHTRRVHITTLPKRKIETIDVKKTKLIIKKNSQQNSMWGAWQSWTNCSRFCGGGVMSQTRNCLHRNPRGNKLSSNCIGLHRRYRICNEQSCSDSELDFREQQCTNFNNQTFKGQKYEWQAYIKDDAECELNCKPIGMNYFATLRDKVIDGTPCSQPADFLHRNYDGKAICVDGVCKAVHSSGIITGAFMNNGAVRCGHLICRPISGLYTKDSLPKGYVHIATIPAGASNISITELKSTTNRLALKYSNQNFIINGDYSVSLSGAYEAAGTTFDYRRIDGIGNGSTNQINRKIEGVTEWITCTGPITEPVHLLILVFEKNPGIKYEYLLPINANPAEKTDDYNDYTSSEYEAPTTAITTTSTGQQYTVKHTLKSAAGNGVTQKIIPAPAGKYNEKKKRRFFWKVVGFTACSKSCGGGSQSPVTRCVRENPIRYFKPKRCEHIPKPVLNENVMRCNTQPCPAYWKIGEWGKCQCHNTVYNNEATITAPDQHHQQEREIKCVQEISPAMVIQVPIVACTDDKPTTSQSCECPLASDYPNRSNSNIGSLPLIKNKIFGISKMPMVIYGNSSISKRTRPNEMKRNGVWLTSDWNSECSTKCNDGIQYRSIFCDRSPPQTERCDPRYPPDSTRQCHVDDGKCAMGDWFIGPWNQCFGDCFNLTQSRIVFCIKNGNVIDESNCDGLSKPITIRGCSASDVSYCKPRWYYSEWSECTKNCSEGTQRRTVKCFEPIDGELKTSEKCRYSQRQPGSKPCDGSSCNPTTVAPITTTTETTIDVIQNDIAPECKDQLRDCFMVMQEHLCQYVYFKENCCETCRVH